MRLDDIDWDWMTLPSDEFLEYMREHYESPPNTDDTDD